MYQVQDFGRIKMIPGDKGGRFPYCNTLLIDDTRKAIIDPGAGLKKLQQVNQAFNIDSVFNTHVHFDHIVYNHVFDQAEILTHELEAIYFRDRREFIKATGALEALGEDWFADWSEKIKHPDTPQTRYAPTYRHEWHLSLARLDGTYKWGDVIDFGHTSMEVIPAPGHTPGFSVMLFPDEGIVYCTDIDLTNFGPWCADSDQFIETAYRIGGLDADVFITGHESGVVTKSEFNSRLDKYLSVICKREDLLHKALEKPMTFIEIVKMGLFYGTRISEDVFIYSWEWSICKEHLRRLVNQGLVVCEQGKYYRRA